MADEKKWYDVVLEYLNNPSTYTVIMGMLTAFGVKISANLQEAISNLGIALAQLGLAIKTLVYAVKEEGKEPTKKEV